MEDQSFDLILFEKQFLESARILTERVKVKQNILIDVNINGGIRDFQLNKNGKVIKLLDIFQVKGFELCPCDSGRKFKKCCGKINNCYG